MQAIKSFKDLQAWQLSVAASLEVYRLTARFPDSERFGLVSQLRRASIAIPANIAEGYGRGSTADYVRFCRIARGSLYEVQTLLLIASELGYVDSSERESLDEQLNECGRVLAGLIRSVEPRSQVG